MIASIIVVGGISYAMGYILNFVPLVPFFGLTSWFYQNLAVSGFIMIRFVVFVFASKAYKLYIRDDIVPHHMIAEDYFVKSTSENECMRKNRKDF